MNKIRKYKAVLIIVLVAVVLVGIYIALTIKRNDYLKQLKNIVSSCIYDYGENHSQYISDADAIKISDTIRKKGTSNDFDLKKLELYSEEEDWNEQSVWIQVYYYASSGEYKDGEGERFKCYFELNKGQVQITKVEVSIN